MNLAQSSVWVLTALAGLVVVLTRLRLGGGGAGRHDHGGLVPAVHTVAGVAASVVWVTFLIAPDASTAGGSLVGIVGLGLWWVVAVAGLMLLTRWMPARGKHAGSGPVDGWSKGPWLSVLAHVGMTAGVAVFTWAYLTHAV